jgi:hypothetical protein
MTQVNTRSSETPRHLIVRLRALLVAVALIPVLLACSNVTSLDSAPASALRITVLFAGALIPGATTTVTVSVDDAHRNPIVFTGGPRMSINGVAIPETDQQMALSRTVTIPRVAAGTNAYTFVYDDGHGHRTEVLIPGPQADFALLQPAAGSQVPLPQPVGAGAGGAGGAQPAGSPDPYQIRPPDLADTPPTVRYGLPYLPSALPSSTSTANRDNQYFVNFDLSGPCATAWPHCNGVRSDIGIAEIASSGVPPTGTWTIDDSSDVWGAGFETLAPGPGTFWANVDVGWDIPNTGFLNCFVQFSDSTQVPITWVSA